MLTVGLTPRGRRILTDAGQNQVNIGLTRFSHIYFSRDAGENWIVADFIHEGKFQLPDVPFNSLAFETVPPHRVFAASDAGVFAGAFDMDSLIKVGALEAAGRDLAKETAVMVCWEDIGGDLPNAPVTDIVYHEKTASLYVSTYGRGLFRKSLKPAE